MGNVVVVWKSIVNFIRDTNAMFDFMVFLVYQIIDASGRFFLDTFLQAKLSPPVIVIPTYPSG